MSNARSVIVRPDAAPDASPGRRLGAIWERLSHLWHWLLVDDLYLSTLSKDEVLEGGLAPAEKGVFEGAERDYRDSLASLHARATSYAERCSRVHRERVRASVIRDTVRPGVAQDTSIEDTMDRHVDRDFVLLGGSLAAGE